jgi:hypothetical protein
VVAPNPIACRSIIRAEAQRPNPEPKPTGPTTTYHLGKGKTMLALFAWLQGLQGLKQVFEHTAFLVALLCFSIISILGLPLVIIGKLFGKGGEGGMFGCVKVPPGKSVFDDDVVDQRTGEPKAPGVVIVNPSSLGWSGLFLLALWAALYSTNELFDFTFPYREGIQLALVIIGPALIALDVVRIIIVRRK